MILMIIIIIPLPFLCKFHISTIKFLFPFFSAINCYKSVIIIIICNLILVPTIRSCELLTVLETNQIFCLLNELKLRPISDCKECLFNNKLIQLLY